MRRGPHLVSIAPSTSTVTLYSTTSCTLLVGSRTTRNTLTLSLPYLALARTPAAAPPSAIVKKYMGGCVEVEKVRQQWISSLSPWEYGRPERRVAPLLDPPETQRRDDRGRQPPPPHHTLRALS